VLLSRLKQQELVEGRMGSAKEEGGEIRPLVVSSQEATLSSS
jgi:hypothetical protein